MKKINDLLTEGKIDLAIALTISMLEPKKTLALNLILMHCLQEAYLKHAEKVTVLLNKKLSNFELKIFVDKDLEQRNFKGAKEAALKMSEPDRTKYLVLVYDQYASRFFNERRYDCGPEILEIINFMTEPSRTTCSDDFVESYLRYEQFACRIVGVSQTMGRTLKNTELNRAFKILYDFLTRRGYDENSYFDSAIDIIELMPRLDKIKNRDLLLAHYLQKRKIDRLIKLSELLEEPELLATLKIIFDLQVIEKNEAGAIKTADKMSEPHRSTVLNNYLNDYVNSGLYERAVAVATVMEKKLENYQLYRIIHALINQKYLDKAWELAKKLNDDTLKSQILNQLFESNLAKDYLGEAYKFALLMPDENNKSKAAQALFDKVIVATNWLSLCKDLPKLFKEADQPAIIKKVQARYLNEGTLVQIANSFRGSGLDKTDFDKVLKKITASDLFVGDFQDLLPVLSVNQKNSFLMTCVKYAIKIGSLDFLKKLLPFISEKQKITSCRKIARSLIRAGNLDLAKSALQLISEIISQTDLEIILKKNITDGFYYDACKVAALLGTELTLSDLDIILRKCLETRSQEGVDEIVQKILAQ